MFLGQQLLTNDLLKSNRQYRLERKRLTDKFNRQLKRMRVPWKYQDYYKCEQVRSKTDPYFCQFSSNKQVNIISDIIDQCIKNELKNYLLLAT